MDLIPAIDLRYGGVVRLTQGDDQRRTLYDVDAKVMLDRCAAAGVGLVHIVDLDAAFGLEPQTELLDELAKHGRSAVQLGGGLGDKAAVEWALNAGFQRVVQASLVVRDFEAFQGIVEAFPGRVVPAVEVAEGKLRIAGWKEEAPISLRELCQKLRGLSCPAVLVTDVDRDGTLEGPNIKLTRLIGHACGFPALLSGGVRSLDDLRIAATAPEISGAIVGKALYDGIFTLEEALKACEGRP
jgi:phosphoribosylformimino-5-aminoimidazole carboxamide ribotide isomerase